MPVGTVANVTHTPPRLTCTSTATPARAGDTEPVILTSFNASVWRGWSNVTVASRTTSRTSWLSTTGDSTTVALARNATLPAAWTGTLVAKRPCAVPVMRTAAHAPTPTRRDTVTTVPSGRPGAVPVSLTLPRSS